MRFKSTFFSKKTNRSVLVGIWIVFGWSFAAHAAPTLFGGNAYEFIADSDIPWDEAEAAAEARTFHRISGHLVTIFSAEENAYVLGLLAISNSAWIGATDAVTEGDWRWVTGQQFWDGDFNGAPVLFDNWADFEPNDNDEGEDYGLILGQDAGFGGFAPGEWNDLRIVGDPSAQFSIAGYVVKFDLLNGLVSKVMNLNINQGIQNNLDAKLNAVLQALDDMIAGNDVAAINALQAFINAVAAQSDNQIPVEDADACILLAQAIIDGLSL